MTTRLYILIALLLLPCYVSGQETGCFKKGTDSGLHFETNIGLKQYSGFIVGEFHDVDAVPELKLALIKYLHENNGINDVFLEIGYAAAYLYNRYLATGDTGYIVAPTLVYAGKKEGRKFWSDLYQYNKTSEGTITIHGFDFERMEFLKALRLLQPAGKQRLAAIADDLAYLDTVSIPKTNSGNLVSIYTDFKQAIHLHYKEYREYYGPRFSDVMRIMDNANTYAQYGERNKNMHTNVTEQLQNRDNKKFVLFAGEKHCNKGDRKSLCGRLSGDMNNALCTIAMLCRSCGDTLLPKTQQISYNGPLSYRGNVKLMVSIYKNNSPGQCAAIMIPSEQVGDDIVSSFSDYILLLK